MAGFPQNQTDPQVLAAACRGERAAQARLYSDFADPVYTIAVRIVGRTDIAEEVMQDTFMEVFAKIDSFRGDAPLAAWIRRIAVNKSLMFLRSAWHRRARPLENCPEPAVDESPQDESGLQQALQQLNPTARAVVWLHDVEGHTHQEIADLMNKSVSFSKSQLARAHKKLRELMTNESGELACMQILSNC